MSLKIRLPVIIMVAFLCFPALGWGGGARAEERTYDTSKFVNTETHGFLPYYYEDSILFMTGITLNDTLMTGIWIMNESFEKHLIYANDSIDYTFSGPKFSPDGETIVFTTLGLQGITLEVLQKNSTVWDENATNRLLFKRSKGALRHPSFSPDGKKIVFYSIEPIPDSGSGDLWVMDRDGTNRTQLTFDKDAGRTPSFSPDGTKIVYGRWSDEGGREIWIMNSDGTGKQRICDDSGHPNNPSFMPDGKILFNSAYLSPHSKEVGPPSIWMMDQDGSNRTLLAPYVISSVGSERPTINQNGTKIAFEHGLGDSFSVHMIEDPDGNGIWEDRDGDFVADVCDGYPDDPSRGYIVGDDDDDDGFLPGFGLPVMVASFLVAVPVVWWGRKENS